MELKLFYFIKNKERRAISNTGVKLMEGVGGLLIIVKQWRGMRAGALVKWLWEGTHVPKVVSSNPGTVYWMDIFHIYLL